MKLINLEDLMKFPIRLDHYDKEHGNETYVFGVEAVLEYAQYLPVIDAEPVKYGQWLNMTKGTSLTEKQLNSYSFAGCCSIC